MRVGIIGLGYVGLTLATVAAARGVDVYGVEVNPKIKACLKENRAHFFEPGLDDLIAENSGKTFHCVEEFPSDIHFDAFVVTVGTPLKPDSKEPNFDYIKQAIYSIPNRGGCYNPLVILRSTVSVGTTRNIVMPLLQELFGNSNVLASMCPERTVEGKALDELTHLPQIISGNNDKAVDIAKKFFLQITDSVIVVDSLEEAELAKLYCNTYRDMNFAIGNAFCIAAQSFGVNGENVIRHANEGYLRAGIALPGFVAGPCLEKDAYILTNNMPDCSEKDFIMSARKINESLEDVVVDWVKRHVTADKILTLSGMAFKGKPETSDLRGSSSVYIARKLNALGYTLKLHDFVADVNEMNALNFGNAYNDFNEACENSAAVLILNNHRNYADVDLRGKIVFDAWGVTNSATAYTLGNAKI